MKRILIVQGGIPPYRRDFFSALADHYEVTVLHSFGMKTCTSQRFLEITTPFWKFGKFFLQANVNKIFTSGDYDAVVAMFDLYWPIAVLALSRQRPFRRIYWGHRYSNNPASNWIRNLLMRRVDGVILYDGCERPRMMRAGVEPTRIYVAPNTIAVPNYGDGSGAAKASFLFVGRAQKRKRVDILLKAFSEVHHQLPPWLTIDIVGDGTENLYLKALSHRLGIANRVVFHGALHDADRLRELFFKAFAYVSPGPVGLGVLHSMAYGVPVVTSTAAKHGPEFQNLKSGENSLLFHDVEELKAILIRLVFEPGLSESLGKCAYRHYRDERSLETMVKGFVKAIENTQG